MNRASVLRHTLIGLILSLMTSAALAQTTAFNYQGKLTDNGTPQSTYQVQFQLYDTLVGGNQIGATITNASVAVNQGVFSIQLDFGASVFTGADRFLEIAVRRNAGENYTTLSPRQQIASSPYSIRTLSAVQADTALDSNKLGGLDASEYVTNSTVGSSFIKNAATIQTGNFNISGNGFIGGNFGVGTTTPTSKLNVLATGHGISQTGGAVTVGSFISIAAGGSGWFGTRSNHPLHFFTGDSAPQMTLSTSGYLGIGTTNPTARLEIVSPPGISGVYSDSPSGRGVWGKSTTSRGVYGESNSLEGVFGISNSGVGVAGRSTTNAGVYGEANTASLAAGGVYGTNLASGGIGIIGEANNGSATGVFGVSTSPTGFGMYARNNFGGRAIFAEGNVAQGLTSNGLVKAMIVIGKIPGNNAGIIRCYNGITNSSTGNCGGFIVTEPLFGVYRIDYGFDISNRFFSVSCKYGNGGVGTGSNNGANYRLFGTNSLEVFTFIADDADDTFRLEEFTVIVF